jgi:hypothetical protein
MPAITYPRVRPAPYDQVTVLPSRNVPQLAAPIPTLIVLSGYAEQDIVSVSGTLTGGAAPIPARTVVFYPHANGAHPPGKVSRWMMVFTDVVVGTTYTLQVTGQRSPALPAIHVPVVSRPFQAVAHLGLNVQWPDNGDTISCVDNDFCPYGSLNYGDDLATAQMSYQDVNGVQQSCDASYIYSDCTQLLFWCAQFPSLVANQSYTLQVYDTASNPFAVNGLLS